MVNGCQIIPVQPFGYNYLGGKLLALISTSHQVREIFNNKYEGKCDILHWETTSLYGDIKGVSQYDGLKPFVRYVDLTESENFLFPTDETYQPILKSLREYYGVDEFGGRLVEQKGSGPKMREFNKVISIIKTILKERGIKTLGFNIFLSGKKATKTIKGGNTDSIYKDNTSNEDKMLDKYLCLYNTWENSVIKPYIKQTNSQHTDGRTHHKISWDNISKVFNNEKVITPKIKKKKLNFEDLGIKMIVNK
jgi:hypothetical protein